MPEVAAEAGAPSFRPAGSAGAVVAFPSPDRLVLRYLGKTTTADRV